MNNNDINKILADLYAIDPSLKNHEKNLIALIRVLGIKPETHLDPAFAAELRSKLLAELAQTKNAAPRFTLADIVRSNTFRYATLSIAVIAIAGVVTFASFRNGGKTGGSLALNSAAVNITPVGSKAFGTLAPSSGNNSGPAQSQSAIAPTANMPQTGSPMRAVNTSAAVSGSSAGSAVAAPGVMAMPIRPIFGPEAQYVYTGNPFSQDQAQLNVLKKITTPFSADQATAALEQAGFGPVNIASFQNLGISNVTLDEHQNFGYELSISFADGSISINENYNEWPQGATTPLTASDIPTDSAVTAVADQFLASHGIATSNYGAPQVIHQDSFAVTMVATPASAHGASDVRGVVNPGGPMIPYFSDSEQVLYPLIVNGKNVYDQSGSEIGLTAEVNVRYNRVMDVYNLQTENYQSSAYDAITSTSTILGMAKNVPSYPMIYNGIEDGANGGKALNTYDLGTPTMAYEDTYQSDSNGQSSEYLVPALVFPVSENGSSTPARNIVVPLIQSFAPDNNPSQIVPMYAPAAASAGAGAVSGGTVSSPVNNK